MSKSLKQLKELKKTGSNLRLAADGWDKPWKTLIATILSARSRDDKTIFICNILFKRYSNLDKLVILLPQTENYSIGEILFQ